MSRTFFLPVTSDLSGTPLDTLPKALLLRNQSDSEAAGLNRAASRQFFPFDYDFGTNTYNKADQTIINLGLLDPVEMWEKAGPPNSKNAPDDFIVALSIKSVDGTGIATAQVRDSGGSPRGSVIVLSGSGESREGIVLLTGDTILLDWLVRPTADDSATVIVNLTEGDGMALQAAAAAWVQANAAASAAENFINVANDASGIEMVVGTTYFGDPVSTSKTHNLPPLASTKIGDKITMINSLGSSNLGGLPFAGDGDEVVLNGAAQTTAVFTSAAASQTVFISLGTVWQSVQGA